MAPRVARLDRRNNEDPLTLALAPPPNETESEKAERLRAEAEAKRISDLIDEELNRQRLAEKKGPKPVKLLLLGQSESGKSTTLKNFQLMNSPKTFRAELASWKAVIQLNLVRSIRVILDAISEAQGTVQSPAARHYPTEQSQETYDHPPLTADHLKLRMRLVPLLQVEEILLSRLTPGGSREVESRRIAALTSQIIPAISRPAPKELAVSAGSGWKVAFTKLLSRSSLDGETDNTNSWNDPEDPSRILHACRDDMIQLWEDSTIQALLKAKKLRLEEFPGFFLDSLARVTALDYAPTDDDILRARLKTLGVSEYRFELKGSGRAVSHDWRIFDVGGQRSLRAAWVSFFDDMNAIIFLAPISCFDQVLVEDHSVNRLEDSVLLWRFIVSNKLLSETSLVLFLNKCDVLQAKLDAGIRLGKYVISYGDRPNSFEHVSEYLKKKFSGIYSDNNKIKDRQFYCHFTSVTNTKLTSVILENVTDTVVRENLKDSSLI